MLYDDLAQKLFGAKRAESNAVLTDATTGTIHGRALTDSADGSVVVEITGDVTNPDPVEIDGEVYYGDADTGIEIPTSENVKAGDEVLVSVYGEGTMRSPAVTSAIGSGDRVAADATAAREIAEATGQHFWDDDSGAHVTELPREEWEQQQTGPNSLWNSLGMLFRDGLMNLLALRTGGAITEDHEAPTDARDGFKINLQAPVETITSVTANGTEIHSMYYNAVGDILYISSWSGIQDGDTVTVSYVGAPQIDIFDGLGNLSSNIVALFSGSVIKFAHDFFRFTVVRPVYGESTGSIKFDPGTGESAEIRLTSDSGRAYVAVEVQNANSNSAALIIDGEGRTLDLTYLDHVAILGKSYTVAQVRGAIPVELFSGTYAQTYNTSITLSETAANFSRLDILYEDSSGSRNSVTVSDPNGKLANCLMAVMTGTPYYYLKAKTYQISGRTIAVQDMGSYQRQGTARIGNNVATQANFNNEIGIVKVYGYR